MNEKSTSDYALWAGLAAAVITFSITPLWSIARCLVTIIHELGHTLFGWLFGYPTIPALDFRYGGGIAFHQGRSFFVLALVYLLLISAIYNGRKNDKAFYVGCGVLLLFSFLAHTDGHMVLILFMGHGFELVLAGLFLYRGLTRSAVIHQSERPLYSGLGIFIILNSLWFAYSIIAIPTAKHRYLLGKGGHLNDFHRIAKMMGLSLTTVAAFFFFTCLLPLAFNFFYRDSHDVEETISGR